MVPHESKTGYGKQGLVATQGDLELRGPQALHPRLSRHTRRAGVPASPHSLDSGASNAAFTNLLIDAGHGMRLGGALLLGLLGTYDLRHGLTVGGSVQLTTVLCGFIRQIDLCASRIAEGSNGPTTQNIPANSGISAENLETGSGASIPVAVPARHAILPLSAHIEARRASLDAQRLIPEASAHDGNIMQGKRRGRHGATRACQRCNNAKTLLSTINRDSSGRRSAAPNNLEEPRKGGRPERRRVLNGAAYQEPGAVPCFFVGSVSNACFREEDR